MGGSERRIQSGLDSQNDADYLRASRIALNINEC
jgi:hypothetical protein